MAAIYDISKNNPHQVTKCPHCGSNNIIYQCSYVSDKYSCMDCNSVITRRTMHDDFKEIEEVIEKGE